VDFHPLGIRGERVDHAFGLVNRDRFAKSARRAECEAEELELVGADPRRLFEQLHAARAHFGVLFISQQFQPVGKRANGGQHIVAQARTQHRGKIGLGNHAAVLAFDYGKGKSDKTPIPIAP